MNYFYFILKCLRRYMYWSGKWRNWKRIMTASQCHQVVHSNPGRVLHPPSTPTSLPSNSFWFAQLSNTQSSLTPGLWNIWEVWGCISPKERGYLCAVLQAHRMGKTSNRLTVRDSPLLCPEPEVSQRCWGNKYLLALLSLIKPKKARLWGDLILRAICSNHDVQWQPDP